MYAWNNSNTFMCKNLLCVEIFIIPVYAMSAFLIL